MISAENEIFSIIATQLRGEYPGIYVSGEEVRTPAFSNSSIAVSIVESSNTVLQRMRTNVIENAVTVMFEVNVDSNRGSGKKAEVKDVIAFIDEQFEVLGFARIMCNPIANLQDATVYRMVARYEGVIMPEYEADKIIYRVYST